jgi:hypothetical protein
MMEDIRNAQLARVCWIGGGTDAGKTTVTRELARQYRLPVYHYDAHDLHHHQRLAERSRDYAAFLAQTLDERWVQPSPDDLLARTWQSFQDRFPFVLEDLTKLVLPAEMPIIAEGYGLTPSMVAPFLATPAQYVCLLPTDDFKVASMARRGKGQFGGQVSDTARATDNLRERDRLITARLRAEAEDLGVTIIEVDGATSTEALAASIGQRFGLSS